MAQVGPIICTISKKGLVRKEAWESGPSILGGICSRQAETHFLIPSAPLTGRLQKRGNDKTMGVCSRKLRGITRLRATILLWRKDIIGGGKDGRGLIGVA